MVVVAVACQGDALPEIQNVDESDTVIWLEAQELPTLEIHSASGIGEVTLKGNMPSEFLVRLHLSGLERFSLQVGNQRYELEYARSGVILSPEESTPLQLASLMNDKSGFILSVKLRESTGTGKLIILSWVDFFR